MRGRTEQANKLADLLALVVKCKDAKEKLEVAQKAYDDALSFDLESQGMSHCKLKQAKRLFLDSYSEAVFEVGLSFDIKYRNRYARARAVVEHLLPRTVIHEPEFKRVYGLLGSRYARQI
jgi:hypothetical protein